MHRDAAVAPLSYQVPGPPSEVWSGPAWQSARAAAWRQPGEAVAAQAMVSPSGMTAAVVAELVRPVASAPRVRLPAEEAAAGLDALAQPPAEASALSEQPPVAAEEASGAMVALPPEAAGVALDAVAEPQRAEAAEGLLGRAGAAAGGGGAAGVGALGAAAGGAPFGASFLVPGGVVPSSLACATTSGAVCACDAEVANCVAVKAVVASSRMRRFVMMSFGSRNRPGSNGTVFIDMPVGRLNG